jgi:hypothetical protein
MQRLKQLHINLRKNYHEPMARRHQTDENEDQYSCNNPFTLLIFLLELFYDVFIDWLCAI